MLKNSFKFLSLALAASLIVAPVSAIDWNSNSSRFGLLGLGFAVTSLIGVMAYNYFYKGAPKQEQNPTVTDEEKKQFIDNLKDPNSYRKDKRIKLILNKLDDCDLRCLVKDFYATKNTLYSIKLGLESGNQEKETSLQEKVDALLTKIEKRLFKQKPVTLNEKQQLYDSLENAIKKWSVDDIDNNFIDQIVNRLLHEGILLEKKINALRSKITKSPESHVTRLNAKFYLFIINNELRASSDFNLDPVSIISPIIDQKSVTSEAKKELYENLSYAARYSSLDLHNDFIDQILEQFEDVDLANLVNNVRLQIIYNQRFENFKKEIRPIFSKIQVKLGFNDNEITDFFRAQEKANLAAKNIKQL